MTDKISLISNIWEGADGNRLIVPLEGEPSGDPVDNFAKVQALPSPRRLLGCLITLENGKSTCLNYPMLASILPDREGVLGIFPKGWCVDKTGADVFAQPNNAAIFNADGSLRFQLEALDKTVHHIALAHGALEGQFLGMMGVNVAFDELHPPEQIFAVDPLSPVLIPTSMKVRL